MKFLFVVLNPLIPLIPKNSRYFKELKKRKEKRNTVVSIFCSVGSVQYIIFPSKWQVRKILAARVPIIKYRQDLTDMECDLSMANRYKRNIQVTAAFTLQE